MDIVNSVFLILAVIYAILIFYFYLGLFRLPRNKDSGFMPKVSILVPARNEEAVISACLQSLWEQTYPPELYEVYIIDDHSTDRTAAVVEKFIRDKPKFHLLRHERNHQKKTFKKQALSFGLGHADGEIVMTIDADTVAREGWIEEILSHYDPETGLVAGLITFDRQTERSVFHKIQTLEFCGIVFCGVGAAGNGNPLICNGSNLSYRLEAFNDAGGYRGNEHLPSGDDDLLLQNIQTQTSWKINYAVSFGSINYTAPVNSFKAFLNQRARWASKSLHYPKRWVFLLMLSIYFFYASLLVLLPFTLLQLFPWQLYAAGTALKMIPEFLLINKGLKTLRRKDLRKFFIPAQIFQIFYILIAGVLGLNKKYTWKGMDGNTQS